MEERIASKQLLMSSQATPVQLGIGRESISGSTDHSVVDAANKRIVAEGYEEVKKKCFEMNH